MVWTPGEAGPVLFVENEPALLEVEREAARAGVDHYLEKPFSLDALWRALIAPDGEALPKKEAIEAVGIMKEGPHEHA